MIRKKKGQDVKEIAVNADRKGREGRFRFSRDKKENEYNLYEDEIEYIPADEGVSGQDETEELPKMEEDTTADPETPDKEEKLNFNASEEIPGEKRNKKKKEKKEKPHKEKKGFFKTKEKGQKQEAVLNEFGEVKRKKISKKKLVLILLAVLLAIAGITVFIFRNMKGGDDGKAYVESVSVLAGLGSANGINNRYTGEVEAQDSWKISLQTDMSVKKCYVSVGDRVKKGDKLFSYNTEELTLSKERKELEVETLSNEITQLTKDIKTYQSDLKSASASEKISLQTEILTAQTTIKKNEYSIKSGKEEIKNLEKNIKDATVKSKMAGLVKSINASVGQSVSDSDESDESTDSGDGTTYMTILALGDYRVKGTISETNVWSISEGDSVIVRSRVDDEQTWSGFIKEVKTDTAEDSENDTETEDDFTMDGDSGESATNYNFYVELDDDDGLMMGQHVFIELDKGQDQKKEGIWIPSAYIRVDGEDYYVWAANKRDRLVKKKIQVGEYNEELDEYQILEGLKSTDYIACDSESLKENMKITKVASEADSTEDGYLDEQPSDDDLLDDGALDDGDSGIDGEEELEDLSDEGDFSDTDTDVGGGMAGGDIVDLSGEE